MPDSTPAAAKPAVSDDTVPAAANSVPAGGAAAGPGDPASLLRPPEASGEVGRLGPFRVSRLLGQGGMGAVFAAEDPLLGRKVALKVMRPELGTRPEARERFLREARAAAAVEHDFIVPVYQVGEDNGVLFIAMPLLQGETLEDRLAREGRLPTGAALKVGHEVAEALAAAHAAGLVHRDIKPGNLWLEGKPGEGPHGFRRVRVLDFGLARLAAGDARLTGDAVVGTPAYMAPEQAAGRPVDSRADLFSLGGVLYRCLTGRLPFPGATAYEVLSALATRTPEAVSLTMPEVPPPLDALVMQLLAKEPVRRPASAAAVAEELAGLRGPRAGETVELPAPRPSPGRARPHRRWPVAAGAALLALLVAAAGVIVVRVKGPGGKETEVRVPEGSTVDVDEKGNVVVTLPSAKGKEAAPAAGRPVAPMPREAVADGPEFVLTAGDQIVDGFVILPDGNTLVAGSRDNRLRVWDVGKREVVREFETASFPRCLALHPDGKTVAVLTDGGELFTWDSATGRVLRRYTSWFLGPRVVGWSIDFVLGGKLLLAPDDKRLLVRAFDTATGEHRVLAEHSDQHGPLVRASPDGRAAAVVRGHDSPVVLALPGGEAEPGKGIGAWHSIPAFTADGKTLAYLGSGNRVWLLDRGAAAPRVAFEAGPKTHQLAFSPDGMLLAAAGTGAGVRVWATRGGPAPVRAWATPAGTTAALRVAFTPDGKRLVSCHDKGTICVFRVRPGWGEPRKPYPPADPAWLARVHRLPSDEQAKEVAAELVRRNPGFDGNLNVQTQDGRVWHAAVSTDAVEDLTPLLGFPHLKALRAVPKPGAGMLWNLAPLAGMRLTDLAIQSNPLWDLAPLKDMPLEHLFLDSTLVHDLAPLAGSPLKHLALTRCPVRDLSPLKGMKLESLFLHNCVCLTDLAPLRDFSVRSLTLPPEFAGDLAPLAAAGVESVVVINDAFRFTPEQRKALGRLKALKTIQGKPPAEYWKGIDGEPKK